MEHHVKIAYFFTVERFPWDLFGWTQPSSGPIHSYMCNYGTLFADTNERSLLASRPTYSELVRFATEHKGIFTRILNYTEDQDEISGRIAKAACILSWLAAETNFTKMMQKRLDYLYLKDAISIPFEARP